MKNGFSALEEPELNFYKLFKVLRRRQRTIYNTTVGLLLLSLLYGFLWPKTYQSVTTVKVPDSSQSSANALREMSFSSTSGDPIETYMQVAAADKVASGVVDALKLRSDPKYKNLTDAKVLWYLHQQVIIDNVKHSDLISIAGRAKTPQFAADLANAWAESFIQVSQDLIQESAQARYEFIHKQLQSIRDKIEENKENKRNFLNQSNELEADELVYKSLLEQDQESRIQANDQNTGIVVVDAAAPPDKASSPKKTTALVLGLFAGVFVGVLAAFVKERMEDCIFEEVDLTQSAQSVLWTEIPWSPAKDQRTVSPASPLISQARFQNSSYLQSFKVLRSHLLLVRPEAGCLAVGIFSPIRGEGRTLTNANLSLALAQAGKKILLVDSDLENPKVGPLFGVEASVSSGLSSLLSGQASLKEVVKSSGVPGLSLLPASSDSTDVSGLLSPSALKKWLEEVKPKFDFILFDGPPLLTSPDSAVLAAALDGIVLLARFGKTRRPDILKSIKQLQSAHVPLWGTVINGVIK